MEYCSEKIELVLAALSKAQGSYKQLQPSGRTASGRKYASLCDIIRSIKDPFSENELSFFQYTELKEGGEKFLHSRIGHSSGQWISSIDRVLGASTIKESNNILEIEKRTQALMILGIAPSDGDPYCYDDDGELEAEKSLVNQIVRNEPDKRNETYQTITGNDYNRIMIEIGTDTALLKSILKEYAIDTIADLPADKYQYAISEIRRIKRIVEEQSGRR